MVENPRKMCQYIQDLFGQCNSEDGIFKLYEHNENIPIGNNVDVIIDVFNLSSGLKIALNTAYSMIKETMADENHYENTSEIIKEIINYVKVIVDEQDELLIVDSDLTLTALLKITNVHFQLSDDSILERLCDYMLIKSRYCKTKLFVFINLKTILTRNELINLYDYTSYNKINILLIEGHDSEILNHEYVTILDYDLCEIHKPACDGKLFGV